MRVFSIILDENTTLSRLFTNYAGILSDANQVYNITAYDSVLNVLIPETIKLPNLCPFDPFSIIKLRKLIKKYEPHLILVHDERSAQFAYYAQMPQTVLVGVAYDKQLKWRSKCNYVIATTRNLRNILIDTYCLTENRISYIPQMLNVSLDKNARFFDQYPTIGVISDLQHDSGIKTFLSSFKILFNTYPKAHIQALISAEYSAIHKLKHLVKSYDLEKYINVINIARNRAAFFENIDIFCAPSTKNMHNSLSILHAMHYTKPIVATRTFAHDEYIDDMANGVLCNLNDPKDMADKLGMFIQDNIFASKIANQGYATLKNHFATSVISEQINKFLTEIMFHEESKCADL